MGRPQWVHHVRSLLYCDVVTNKPLFEVEKMAFFSPFFRNPITDFTGPLWSAQTGLRCAEFEMKMMSCYEAYGYPRGIEVCEAYYDDFKECCTRDKQMARVTAIRMERDSKPDPKYEKPPAMHVL